MSNLIHDSRSLINGFMRPVYQIIFETMRKSTDVLNKWHTVGIHILQQSPFVNFIPNEITRVSRPSVLFHCLGTTRNAFTAITWRSVRWEQQSISCTVTCCCASLRDNSWSWFYHQTCYPVTPGLNSGSTIIWHVIFSVKSLFKLAPDNSAWV